MQVERSCVVVVPLSLILEENESFANKLLYLCDRTEKRQACKNKRFVFVGLISLLQCCAN